MRTDAFRSCYLFYPDVRRRRYCYLHPLVVVLWRTETATGSSQVTSIFLRNSKLRQEGYPHFYDWHCCISQAKQAVSGLFGARRIAFALSLRIPVVQLEQSRKLKIAKEQRDHSPERPPSHRERNPQTRPPPYLILGPKRVAITLVARVSS